jgi:hypothetical protein
MSCKTVKVKLQAEIRDGTTVPVNVLHLSVKLTLTLAGILYFSYILFYLIVSVKIVII